MAELAWVTTAFSATTRAASAPSRPRIASALLVEIDLGATERAVPVDRPGQLAADIGVVERPEARRQHTGVRELVDPALPVIAAHHSDGGRRLLLVRRLERGLEHLAGFGVERLDLDRERRAA